MGSIIARFVWFLIVAGSLAYGSLWTIENVILSKENDYSKIIVRDVIKPGEHDLSGMIMVPSLCDWLAVQTSQVDDKTYMLTFKTWQEPYRDCTKDSIPRSFQATVFAPATGVDFLATLDGRPLALSVVPAVYKRK